ncbi:unnamed protein product [Trifolium pratense]|uniref:Uncharacterized protein n=1 Tax=Trifolium pratense TaxID=57577 RepID=A0ACB0M8R2_TRIPR|nr:unnamed protein product [Trifolium pratense]
MTVETMSLLMPLTTKLVAVKILMKLISKLVHKLQMDVRPVFSIIEPKMHSTTMVELGNLERPSLILALT